MALKPDNFYFTVVNKKKILKKYILNEKIVINGKVKVYSLNAINIQY